MPWELEFTLNRPVMGKMTPTRARLGESRLRQPPAFAPDIFKARRRLLSSAIVKRLRASRTSPRADWNDRRAQVSPGWHGRFRGRDRALRSRDLRHSAHGIALSLWHVSHQRVGLLSDRLLHAPAGRTRRA